MMLAHPDDVHYTEGPQRWEGINEKLRVVKNQFPAHGDCSSTVTWILWNAITHGIKEFKHGRDELYQNSLMLPGSEVLFTAYSDKAKDTKNTGKDEPMGLGAIRVFFDRADTFAGRNRRTRAGPRAELRLAVRISIRRLPCRRRSLAGDGWRHVD